MASTASYVAISSTIVIEPSRNAAISTPVPGLDTEVSSGNELDEDMDVTAMLQAMYNKSGKTEGISLVRRRTSERKSHW